MGGLLELRDVFQRWSLGDGPLYEKLADHIRAGISSREIAPGTRLPAERELARRLAISRTTVVAAYAKLQEEGVVERHKGSGTYVCRQHRTFADSVGVVQVMQTPRAREPERPEDLRLVDFMAAALPGVPAITEPALADLRQALQAAAAGHGYNVLGIPQLRDSVAAYFTSSGVPTKPSEVLITCGAQQAIALCATYLIEPGDVVLIEDPTWVGAIDVFRTARARLVSVPVDEEGIRTDICERLITKHSPRLIYITPTVHNPTGVIMSDRRRGELAKLVGDAGIIVLEDNTLGDLLFDRGWVPRPLAARLDPMQLFTAGSMSKTFWGGLRIGWIRADEATILGLGRLKLVIDHGTSLPSQLLAAGLLRSIDEVRDMRVRQLTSRLTALTDALSRRLPSWTWQQPAGGVSLWIGLPAGNADEFSQVAYRHGVALVTGTVLSPSHSHADHIRIPYVLSAAELADGVDRLAASWSAYLTRRAAKTVHSPVI